MKPSVEEPELIVKAIVLAPPGNTARLIMPAKNAAYVRGYKNALSNKPSDSPHSEPLSDAELMRQ